MFAISGIDIDTDCVQLGLLLRDGPPQPPQCAQRRRSKGITSTRGRISGAFSIDDLAILCHHPEVDGQIGGEQGLR